MALIALKVASVMLTFLAVCLVAWIVVFDGIVADIVYKATPQIAALHQSTDKGLRGNTAVLYLTGTQSSAMAHSAPMLDLWRQHGDVIVVEYDRHRFDGPTVVKATYKYLTDNNYSRVIVIGASIGGLLATDLVDYNNEAGSSIKIDIILVDTPFDASDIVLPGMKAISRWNAGPVGNMLFTKLVWATLFHPPARHKLGTDVDDGLLRAHYQASKTWPMSVWTDQIRYLVDHKPIRPGRRNGSTIILHSALFGDNDGVVTGQAAERLREVLDFYDTANALSIKVEGGARHIDFVEHPSAWREAFNMAFAAIK